MPAPGRLVRTIARRFLMSKSSGGFLSFISGVSVVGVAVGVLALVVVTSVINGFEGELTKAIVGLNGEVILQSRGTPISRPQIVSDKIRSLLPEATGITASFVSQLMIAGPDAVAGAILEGVQLDTVGTVTRVPDSIVEGRLPNGEGEVVVAAELAKRIGATVGEQVRLIAPFVGDQEENGKEYGTPKVLPATVVGIFKMGFYEYDSKYVLSDIRPVQKFLEQEGKVTSFKVRLKSNADPIRAAERLSDNFGYPFRAKYWGQLNRNLFYAIRLEKIVISILLTAIIVVAAFNVISALMMMIHDKAREIAILKAMGLDRRSSFSLFALIGTFIGFVGSVAGLALGLGINNILHRTKLITLPAEIYYIGYLPVVIRWEEVLVIAVLGVLVSFAATLYPAFQVSRRSPLDGLRYE
jgi:lipoprotein-releasing system permease protein